jgi:hypothetical protein
MMRKLIQITAIFSCTSLPATRVRGGGTTMIKRFASKAVVLSALLATGATVTVQTVLAQTAMAQGASSVTLELFNAKPSESSQATASLEIGTGGGNLQSIETPEQAGKARYLRAKVSSASGVENYLYRVIGNPNNGRIFIITPERKAIALNKFLISTGLEVSADKGVKLGAQTDFSSTKSAVTDTSVEVANSTAADANATTTPAATPTEAATPASTAAADSSTPADASATPATDSSTTAAPADSSTTTTAAPADATATPAAESSSAASTTAPADTTSTPATDGSSTATTAAPAETSAAPATDANATPATDSSSMASSEAKPLTAPVSTTVGQVEVQIIPNGAPAPASSEKNIILAPVADALEAKSSVDGNVVTLTYDSKSSLEVVSGFYDEQLKAQGFTHDTASADNQQGEAEVVKVYKRGTASMTMTVRAENGAYMVEVDLEKLASGS